MHFVNNYYLFVSKYHLGDSMHAHANLLQSDPPEILDLLEWCYWYMLGCVKIMNTAYTCTDGNIVFYDLLLIWDLMYKNNYNNNGKL